TQVVFDTIQQMEVNAFFPMPLSSYGYMQKNESKELIIHSDQMVDFTLLYGMESQSTYDRYMECMFGWGVVATCNIKLSRFNNTTQLFETVFEYSATPILDLNFPDNEQEFEDRKSSAFFTDNPSVFLTEGRYKLECN